MTWKKLGLVFCPDRNYPWMISHAANPTAEHLEGDLFRIYFGCRDDNNRTSIASVELDITVPQKILRISEKPVVSPGELGAFDDSGASMGCLVSLAGKRYLYYVGWNLGVTVPWRNSIGLAVSETANAPFVRVSRAPIMDRSDTDPFSLSYPWVIRDEDGWRMWYGSNVRWGPHQQDMEHVIRCARSADGINWERAGSVALGFESPGEYAMSRPCVVRDNDLYRMWYSFRGEAYRIGYAESEDGFAWTRKDREAGLSVSDSGWDSESVEYPYVFEHCGSRYMLYNGNGYGRTGFGLAVMTKGINIGSIP